MTPAHVRQLIDALISLFDPVVQAIEDEDSAEALLKDMGYQAPSRIAFLNDFSPLLGALLEVANEADDLVRSRADVDSLALFRSLIDAIQGVIKLIRDIGSTLQVSFPADFLAATDIAAQFPRQLADYLLVRMIERQFPVLHSSLVLTGIIDEREVTTVATPFNMPYKKRVIRWEKLGDYVDSPLPSIQEAYGWNTDSFEYDRLIGNIHRFGQSIRFFSSHANPDPDTLQALNGGTDIVTDDNADKLGILKFPLLPVLDSPIGAEIYPVLNAAKDKVTGLGLGFYFDPSAGVDFPITDDLSLGIKYAGTVPLDAAVLVLPGQPLQPVSNIFGGSEAQADLSTFVPEFTYSNTDGKALLFHSSFGAKLEFTSWALRAGVLAGASGFYIETDLKGTTLTISSEGGDGFLQEILPSRPMALNFDFSVGFSSERGLYFGGSVGLEVKIPSHVNLGAIALDGITVSLKPANGKIPLMLGTDVSARLGPMNILVQNVGAEVVLSFPAKRDGNAGPMQVDLGFKPPSGAGLAIDAPGVSGGGFLFFFPQTGNYAGSVVLSVEGGLTIKAQGLIATRLPDGSKGYSLLVIITAEGFKPIPLGLGFKLTGIGGMLAINRTFNEDVLREGVKNHTLDSVLFPANPIRDALQLLSGLNKVFPVAPGHHLFGPMVEIEWATPTLITMQLGIVLEIGAAAASARRGPGRGDPAEKRERPAADQDGRGRDYRLRPGHGVARRGALRVALAEEVRAHRRNGHAAAMEGRAELRAGHWRSAPRVQSAGKFPEARPHRDQPQRGRQSADHVRCLFRRHFEHGAVRRAGESLRGRAWLQHRRRYRLRRAHPARSLSLPRRIPRVRFSSSAARAIFSRSPWQARSKGRGRCAPGAKATFEILWWDVSVSFDKTLVQGAPPPPPPGDRCAQRAGGGAWRPAQLAGSAPGRPAQSGDRARAAGAERSEDPSAREVRRETDGRAVEPHPRHRQVRQQPAEWRAALQHHQHHRGRRGADTDAAGRLFCARTVF